MNDNKFLAVILILGLILRLLSAFAIPIFDKPDEGPHFEYMQFVAENKKLPVQQPDTHGEFFQPPFYYILASFFLGSAKLFTQELAYLVISMRILSVIFSILTLYLIYKISSLIFKNSSLILGIVAFAAFLPSHINLNSAATNANFADFLAALIIYIILSILIKDNKNKIFLLGLVVGIALITRTSLIPIALTIPFAFIVKYYPRIKSNMKIIGKNLAVIVIISLAISGWHFIRNFNLYGDVLGVNAMKMSSPPDNAKLDSIFVIRMLGWTFVTFWASFGRTNNIFIGNLNSTSGIVLFISAYLILLSVTFIALYGLYKFLKEYRKNKSILSRVQKKAFVIISFYLLLLALFFIAFNLYDFQPQGRLFFPALSAISILFTFGFYNNFSTKNWKGALISYIAFFILLDIISIGSILNHYLSI